jgi:cellobiose phosphorylase
VITTPATPLPWINYLGNQEFFGLISNTGGGYCFYRDAKLQRLIRYRYNNIPADMGGRFYYLKEEAPAPWSPAFILRYAARRVSSAGTDWDNTVFESAKNGLLATLTCFVSDGRKTARCIYSRFITRRRRKK